MYLLFNSDGHYANVVTTTTSTTTAVTPLQHHFDGVAAALVDTMADVHGPHVALNENGDSLNDECARSQVMGSLVQHASPFLFPCAIEYR